MINKQKDFIEFLDFSWKTTKLSINNFRDKIESMLIWWAIWDALWVPVEMKSYQHISDNYNRLDTYLDSAKNIFFKKHWLEDWISWLVSDDTVMTFAWVDSIINTSKIDFKTIMDISLEAFINHPYWFWSWHRNAFEKYSELQKNNPDWENYLNLWSQESSWNWVMMKQSPYRAYYSINDFSSSEIDENIKTLTKLTHANPTAIIASLVHNRFLIELIKADKDIDFTLLLDYLIWYAKEQEKDLDEEINDKISDLLIKLLDDYKNWWLNSYEEILAKYWWWDKKIFSSWYVFITMWIVYSIFLNKQNFEWLLDSVNIGWDTDTYAAIIWNMIWAYKWKFFTKEYENWLQDIEIFRVKTKKFVDILLKN